MYIHLNMFLTVDVLATLLDLPINKKYFIHYLKKDDLTFDVNVSLDLIHAHAIKFVLLLCHGASITEVFKQVRSHITSN